MEKLSTIQKHNNLNAIYRYDQPETGGACYSYDIYPMESLPKDTDLPLACIEFQQGARNDPQARHGVVESDLLEIVRDRLIAHQSGPLATRENKLALRHIEEALLWLNKRVEDRAERGVLGTMKK